MCIAQQCVVFSDEAIEGALYDSPSDSPCRNAVHCPIRRCLEKIAYYKASVRATGVRHLANDFGGFRCDSAEKSSA